MAKKNSKILRSMRPPPLNMCTLPAYSWLQISQEYATGILLIFASIIQNQASSLLELTDSKVEVPIEDTLSTPVPHLTHIYHPIFQLD